MMWREKYLVSGLTRLSLLFDTNDKLLQWSTYHLVMTWQLFECYFNLHGIVGCYWLKELRFSLQHPIPIFGCVATNYTVNRGGEVVHFQLGCSCNGYRMHSGPSPPRPRRQEASIFDDAVGPRYTRGYQGDGRGRARFREGSPPYGRGSRSYGRGYSAPGKEFINIDGEYVHRNDPNLSPREGDWICQIPNCGNLNFARRTHCNNCNKSRYAPEIYEPSHSPRRGYISPPRGPQRIVGPPGDRAPPREMTRYRSPPHGWGVDDPRGYAARSPPDRAGRFTEPSLKERMGFRGERDLRDRAKFEWSATDDYSQRERPHDGLYPDRSHRRSGSPRGNWGNDLRDRSRSPQNRPMKSSFTGRGRPDDYADPYVNRGRPNLEAGRGRGRGRGGYRPGGGPFPGEGRGDRHAAPALRGRNEDGY
ncbi:uncharacterized protein LOC133883702 isoform X2 [Phragmites australis]|uniref:uncharacterized protein LOC133883702 isoform X2 n=1 Tax=Phragmites australis TaxID=29695 RepID=UPI002D79D3F7|nr:uncharacterized protein LOC133883702 isoform X2 [Phragmites australis]XP_062179105.1 uncharacterized protein LOC133883702 isoform X2 [Phragmites australis]